MSEPIEGELVDEAIEQAPYLQLLKHMPWEFVFLFVDAKNRPAVFRQVRYNDPSTFKILMETLAKQSWTTRLEWLPIEDRAQVFTMRDEWGWGLELSNYLKRKAAARMLHDDEYVELFQLFQQAHDAIAESGSGDNWSAIGSIGHDLTSEWVKVFRGELKLMNLTPDDDSVKELLAWANLIVCEFVAEFKHDMGPGFKIIPNHDSEPHEEQFTIEYLNDCLAFAFGEEVNHFLEACDYKITKAHLNREHSEVVRRIARTQLGDYLDELIEEAQGGGKQ